MILAIDIGGTKMAAGAVDESGVLAESRRTSTPRAGGPEEIWSALLEMIEALRGPFEGVGVGCGGPMAPRGERVSPLNIPGWRDFPLRARLSSWSGLRVEIDNDAKALTAGEWWQGSLSGRDSAMGMVVSTGVGGGLVLDGRLVDGKYGQAGHIGHVIVVPGGIECACGARGCLEAEIRGPSLEEQCGHPPPFPDDLLARAGRLLGRALASAAALCDLEAVAVGGGVADGAGELLLGPAREEITQAFRIFERGLEVVSVSAGPLVGAAAIFLMRSGRM